MGDMINWSKFVYEWKPQQTAAQRYRYSEAFLASWGKNIKLLTYIIQVWKHAE